MVRTANHSSDLMIVQGEQLNNVQSTISEFAQRIGGQALAEIERLFSDRLGLGDPVVIIAADAAAEASDFISGVAPLETKGATPEIRGIWLRRPELSLARFMVRAAVEHVAFKVPASGMFATAYDDLSKTAVRMNGFSQSTSEERFYLCGGTLKQIRSNA